MIARFWIPKRLYNSLPWLAISIATLLLIFYPSNYPHWVCYIVALILYVYGGAVLCARFGYCEYTAAMNCDTNEDT